MQYSVLSSLLRSLPNNISLEISEVKQIFGFKGTKLTMYDGLELVFESVGVGFEEAKEAICFLVCERLATTKNKNNLLLTLDENDHRIHFKFLSLQQEKESEGIRV